MATAWRVQKKQAAKPIIRSLQNLINIACEIDRMAGAGRGAGEPPEAGWSHFGPYGYLLQYASKPARQAALERIARYWNAQKLVHLPALLTRMFLRAGRAMLEAEQKKDGLLQHVTSQGMTLQEVNAQCTFLISHLQSRLHLETCCTALSQNF